MITASTAKAPGCTGTPIGTSQATTPVTIAAAPIQIRKKPGATISAAASSTPTDSHIQCGSMLVSHSGMVRPPPCGRAHRARVRRCRPARSEEHTSELQSLMRISYAVFCLKKKQFPFKTPTLAQKTHNLNSHHYSASSMPYYDV